MESYNLIALVIIGMGAGYLLFLLLFLILPKKLRSGNSLQRTILLDEARTKAAVIRKEDQSRVESQMALAMEELEAEAEERKLDLEAMEQELNSREQFVAHEEARHNKIEQESSQLRARLDRVAGQFKTVQTEMTEAQTQLRQKLETKSGRSSAELLQRLTTDMIEDRRLESTKYLKVLAEDLSTSANRLATRLLARSHARYAPEFVWPKGINHVEVTEAKAAEYLASDACTLLKDLTELTEGVTIALDKPEKSEMHYVRFAGGYGIYKEAAKLTVEELLPRHPNTWGRVKEIYEKHKRNLGAQALHLGKRALVELKLTGLHVEILKMIGSLNWRTSYRQNQFYHSIEVAKLAGILATELGVDADAAKRCGLLHDIGKSIDYRIEGSHAVISGDYADRYGESKLICDTVMSHHADLLVETPLAYVLRSADTLSGARPGARVNLEEGYQDRLTSITDVIRAFPGVQKVEIMNGAREVHVEVNHKRIPESDLEGLSQAIARRIETEVAFPGQIKVLVARRFEAVAVA